MAAANHSDALPHGRSSRLADAAQSGSRHGSRRAHGPATTRTDTATVTAVIGPASLEIRRPWNASTLDEAHPFPQRALTHTAAHYEGVDVVDTHFPETVKGTVALRRNGEPPAHTGVWSANVSRAKFSNRYTFQSTCNPALRSGYGNETRGKSYLAAIIIADSASEKQQRRVGWKSSSMLDDHRRNPNIAAPPESVDYREVNKRNPAVAAALEERYVPPHRRVEQQYHQQRQAEAQRRAAVAAETAATMWERPDAPAVFTMSNVDSWWSLDPVQVAAEQAARKEVLRANPYSSLYAGGSGGADKT